MFEAFFKILLYDSVGTGVRRLSSHGKVFDVLRLLFPG